MNSEILSKRIKQFALDVVYFCRCLPINPESNIFKNQLIKSSTSAAANYRASRCGRSRKEWIAKLSISIEEIDESAFWLEFMDSLDYPDQELNKRLLKEAQELTLILGKTRSTARKNDHRK